MKHRIVQALAGLLVLSFVCRATAEDYEYYTRYVESDGTQSIDLGFTLSSDMTIECVFEQFYKGGIGVLSGAFRCANGCQYRKHFSVFLSGPSVLW